MGEIWATTPWWLPRVRRLSFSTGTSCVDAMPQAEVAQFGHQLPFGAFANVEFFDLFARFDRFDYGADAEYKVFRHGIGRFVS